MEIDVILSHEDMVDNDCARASPFSSSKPGLAAKKWISKSIYP